MDPPPVETPVSTDTPAEEPVAAATTETTTTTTTAPTPGESSSTERQLLPEPAALEVDSQPSDTDSALGDVSHLSSTTSVHSSVYNYVVEHGRSYHAFNRGKYVLPNDEQEQERLDLQHHLFLLTFDNRLHLAPIGTNPQNVLDIGTGTGIWAIEFADEYPSARVTGTDLSPIQPPYVPPNCEFEVSDAEEEWNYHKLFDYIHGRALLTCFKDPRSIIGKAYENLAPGGWLEFQDPTVPFHSVDDTYAGSAMERWLNLTLEGAAVLGRKWNDSTKNKQWMEEAGFVEVVQRHFQWPIGTWPRGKHQKMLGLWCQQDMMDGVQAVSLAVFTRGLKWTREEFELLIMEVREEMKSRRIHAFIDVCVTYGRKPL